MPDKQEGTAQDSIGAWAKRCYFAGRDVMDSVLRPHGLGSVQWYVLHRLATVGPVIQRDLGRLLEIERATMSGIVATLVRKGLVEQVPDQADQRQKLLRLTDAGAKLWTTLPDLSFIRAVAFGGMDEADIETAIGVLRTATERLESLLEKGNRP
ncbi:putative MarR family transcriptional regulator [Sphingobium sp. SYK-6]|uniref:MarR family winged helix-turn-helix transcriptional regulator n=1 Tax=Sphingobium sp. (strain NBRC 103272 / SYK-6) TaxID=627192 RepID=UPI0002276F9F|nr:MarR family transcriptional regulator [Sphingobium sp. SYK-6]BAK67427.1 putative MarR family transcriptional regulator [Sphingobium sp. SYK-6]